MELCRLSAPPTKSGGALLSGESATTPTAAPSPPVSCPVLPAPQPPDSEILSPLAVPAAPWAPAPMPLRSSDQEFGGGLPLGAQSTSHTAAPLRHQLSASHAASPQRRCAPSQPHTVSAASRRGHSWSRTRGQLRERLTHSHHLEDIREAWTAGWCGGGGRPVQSIAVLVTAIQNWITMASSRSGRFVPLCHAVLVSQYKASASRRLLRPVFPRRAGHTTRCSPSCLLNQN